jgi:hypothetical protein
MVILSAIFKFFFDGYRLVHYEALSWVKTSRNAAQRD